MNNINVGYIAVDKKKLLSDLKRVYANILEERRRLFFERLIGYTEEYNKHVRNHHISSIFNERTIIQAKDIILPIFVIPPTYDELPKSIKDSIEKIAKWKFKRDMFFEIYFSNFKWELISINSRKIQILDDVISLCGYDDSEMVFISNQLTDIIKEYST